MHQTKRAARKRAIATRGQDVAKHRYQIYKSAFARLKEAQSHGFFLEAITLVESLVSDRLESYFSFVSGEDFSFKTLEKLIKKSQSLKMTDPILRAYVELELQTWAAKRNRALHEMAKIEIGDASSWDERYSLLEPVVDSGLKLLRKIDKQINKLSRSA